MYLFTLIPTLLILLWYNIGLVSRFGGTPGKLIVGIKVIRLDEQPVTLKEAFLRYSVLLAITIFGCTITVFSLFAVDARIYDSLGWLQQQQYLSSLSPTLF